MTQLKLGLAIHAAEQPDKVALSLSGKHLTYGELNNRINQLVHGLAKRNLNEGDRVCFMLYNSFECFEISGAANKLGLMPVPINYHFKSQEVEYILNDSECKAFIVGEEFLDVVLPILENLKTVPKENIFVVGQGSTGRLMSYEDLLAGQTTTEPPTRNAVDMRSMIYTSGTTGNPKGVYKDQDPEAVVYFIELFCKLFDFTPDDVHLLPGPFYHSAPNSFSMMHLTIGASVVIMPKFDTEECLRVIQDERVTTVHMVPTMFHRILNLPPEVRDRYDVSCLKSVVHAAAPCPVETKFKMMDYLGKNRIYEYYASTEMGGTYISPDEWLQKPGSVGRPWPDTTLKIYDDDGDEVATGEIGEIYMRNHKMSGFTYYKDPEKTSSSFREGLFTAGDMGYLDEDGYLFIADRKKDMIISGGVNIYPAEIEAVLHNHPKIFDVAVIGVPDQEWGEAIKAVVQLNSGVEATEQEIIVYCNENLAGYKRPRSVEFVMDLPRQPSGKLYKRKIREKYWEGQVRKV
ncbi:MAG: AMP-binding protein [Bacillota bacterium]